MSLHIDPTHDTRNGKSRRKAELDWLRLMAIGILLFYHVGMWFSTYDWHLKNRETSAYFDYVMMWFHQWRMPMLLFIAGISAQLAFGKRTATQFVSERLTRLFIPLLFGMFVIVPPQIYYEKINAYASYFYFYPTVFEFTPYPDGNLSWHHLWFILYLFLYSLLATPLLIWLGKIRQGDSYSTGVQRCRRPLVMLFIPPLIMLLSQLVLRPYFPKETHTLYDDWAYFLYYGCYFIAGMWYIAIPGAWETLRKRRHLNLLLSLALLLPFYATFFLLRDSETWLASRFAIEPYELIGIWVGWFTACALIGYAQRHLNQGRPWLRHATEGLYPFYIIHQTAIIVIGYYVCLLDWGIGTKFCVISGLTLVSCMVLYFLIIRPFRLMRWLLGMKAKKTTITLFLLAFLPLGEAVAQDTYFSHTSADGRWMISSAKAEGKSFVHSTESDSPLVVSVLPFLIEDICYSRDGRYAYVLHSKTFWHASLSRVRTEDWNVLKTRKITDLTREIELNADETSLVAVAGSVIRRIDPNTLRTQRVTWEKSRFSLLTSHPKDPAIAAARTRQNEVEVLNLMDETSFIALRHQYPITQLRFDPLGRHLTSVDDAGYEMVWQIGDSTLAPNVGKTLVGFMPMFSYAPDTRLLLGLSNSLVFGAHRPRPTVMTTSVSYAFSNQVEVTSQLEHFTDDGWQFYGRFLYQYGINTQFFGTGMRATPRVSSRYRQNTLLINADILKQAHGPTYLGVRYSMRDDGGITFEDTGNDSWPSSRFGGITSGLGVLARFDNRDEVIFPSSGWFTDLNLMRYGRFVGSAYTYNELLADVRHYRKLGSYFTGSVLAIQFVYQVTSGGEVPFYSLPYIGNDRFIRGSWRNLYVDQQAVGIQTEFRSHFTPVDTRHAYVIFAGAGNVSPAFTWENGLVGVLGVGYRWQLIPKKRLHFRFDASLSDRGNAGLFWGIGTAF